MKNLGFTLVELLAVIVVLGAIIAIASVTISGVLDSSESKLNDIQIDNIEKAAKTYYVSEGMEESDFEDGNYNHCVSVDYLMQNGYLDATDISEFKDEEMGLGSVKISYESKKYKYTYQEKECMLYQTLDKICKPVTSTTKTTGNVPQGNFEAGDEYICEVKPGTKYHFFVVSATEKIVNLILDRNINSDGTLATEAISVDSGKKVYSLSYWLSKEDYIKSDKKKVSCSYEVCNDIGPLTALNFLDKATESWTNIVSLNEIYKDENITSDTQEQGNGGYGKIRLTGKARLPKYSEIHGEGLCLYSTETSTPNGSCPLWISNYLMYDSNVSGSGLQNIDGMQGYWTMATHTRGDLAWYVYYKGTVANGYIQPEYQRGVRPVISLAKEYEYLDRW